MFISKERHLKNSWVTQPGIVGSVGDVNVTPRLPQSAPDFAIRLDAVWAGKNAVRLGSSVGVARGFEDFGRQRRVANGWVYQDLRVPDKRTSPLVTSTPAWGETNRIATVYQARTNGANFLPLPQGYTPNGVPRGAQVPQHTVIAESQNQPSSGLGVIAPPDAQGQLKNGPQTLFTGSFDVGSNKTSSNRMF